MTGVRDVTRTRRWWLVFAGVTALVTGALSWITVEMVRLEKAELAAREEATHQESLRLALWRMDSWFAPHLAREAARQYVDYQAFFPQERAYTRLLYEIEPGEVLTPSPLLTFRSEYIRLHFQVWPDGRITSPQVPAGNLRDLAEGVYLSPERIAECDVALASVRELIAPPQLMQCVADAETIASRLATANLAAEPPVRGNKIEQSTRSQQEWSRRQQAYVQNSALPAPEVTPTRESSGAGIEVGPLVAVWSAPNGDVAPGTVPSLLFVRRVVAGAEDLYQGFLCDWPKLREAMLAQVGDLFPGLAGIALLADTDVDAAPGSLGGHRLATIPARLDVPDPVTLAPAWITPARSTLAAMWVAVAAGLVAVAITLRSSIAFGEKRSRFASAVTHELRTPLTTFRLYSEMLAEGMVQSEEQRRSYLQTLRHESERLATLVENVLAYARIERGTARVEPIDTTLAGLLERLEAAVASGVERAGMTLRVEPSPGETGGETGLRLDQEAVTQIVTNLVDNACKYASGADDRTIHLAARLEGATLVLGVRDHGPGIDPRHVRAVFAPFDRGSRGSGDPTPGVGLGLALARGVARTLGGDVRLVPLPAGERGASFEVAILKRSPMESESA